MWLFGAAAYGGTSQASGVPSLVHAGRHLEPFDRSRTFQVQILEDLKADVFLNTPYIELSPRWEASSGF